MIQKYKSFNESRQEIEDLCFQHLMWEYTINSDGTVDVDGDVQLDRKDFRRLPIRFGKVSGNFHVNNNELITLEGSPSEVGGDFWCGHNSLVSLEGCPTKVGVNFNCSNNILTSLVGCPDIIVGEFSCGSNEITTLEGGPVKVGGRYSFRANNIKSFKGFPEIFRPSELVFSTHNPVNSVFEMFDKSVEAIPHINEWDVIDVENMEVSYSAMEEVWDAIGSDPTPFENVMFKDYTLIA